MSYTPQHAANDGEPHNQTRELRLSFQEVMRLVVPSVIRVGLEIAWQVISGQSPNGRLM